MLLGILLLLVAIGVAIYGLSSSSPIAPFFTNPPQTVSVFNSTLNQTVNQTITTSKLPALGDYIFTPQQSLSKVGSVLSDSAVNYLSGSTTTPTYVWFIVIIVIIGLWKK